jgi:ankyrin repeat protein
MGCTQSSSAATGDSQTTPKAYEAETAAVTVQKTPQPLNQKAVHSAVRWNNSYAEVEELVTSKEAANCIDEKNGNRPIHIAAQNGHLELVNLLISRNAELGAKNAKGNTALHMAIGYDYYETAQVLMKAGADPEVLNDSAIPAKLGLEGDKALGIAALIHATTPSEVNESFQMCEDVIKKLNRVNFVQAGLKAKKSLGELWTPEMQSRFKEITGKLSN